jgi:hypothetical protein
MHDGPHVPCLRLSVLVDAVSDQGDARPVPFAGKDCKALTIKTLPAWVETLRRYRMRLAGASGLIHLEPDAEGTWVEWADLVAACPPASEVESLEAQIRTLTAERDSARYKLGWSQPVGTPDDAFYRNLRAEELEAALAVALRPGPEDVAACPPEEKRPAGSFGYCAICYHPLDQCRHCDGQGPHGDA